MSETKSHKLNLEQFGELSVDDLVFLAKKAEVAERFDDMTDIMTEVVNRKCKDGKDLSVHERNLLSVSYKNVIGTRRAAWRAITQLSQELTPITKQYLAQVEAELEKLSSVVISLLDDQLVPVSEDDVEAQVFYLKMCGDYHRYMAEVVSSERKVKEGEKAKEKYETAFGMASKMPPTNPIRLGLALNYSVCHYEILEDHEAACALAKSAFDEAIAQLDRVEENDYKDTTLIMQLLRDNLTLWTQDQDDQ